MDQMDELEALADRGDDSGTNFIPCIKWVKRGVAKSQPEKVPFLISCYKIVRNYKNVFAILGKTYARRTLGYY